MSFNIKFELARFNKSPKSYMKCLPNIPESAVLIYELVENELKNPKPKKSVLDHIIESPIEIESFITSELKIETKLKIINTLLKEGVYDDISLTYFYSIGYYKSTNAKSLPKNEHIEILKLVINDLTDQFKKGSFRIFQYTDILSLGKFIKTIESSLNECDKKTLVGLMPLVGIINNLDDAIMNTKEVKDYLGARVSRFSKPSEMKKTLTSIANHIYADKTTSILNVANALGTLGDKDFWQSQLIESTTPAIDCPMEY